MRLVDAGAVVAAAVLAGTPLVAAGVVSLDLTRATPQNPVSPLLSKRATVAESIANNITGGGYYIDVTVGTPAQPARMVLDTGSSDAWVVATGADLCKSARLQKQYQDTCSSTYDSSKSSTYTLVESNGFSIQYLDGSAAEGDYVTEVFTIGGTTINGLQMGVADTTVRGTGILGVGYSAHVAAAKEYPNIIDQMKSQSLIPVKAYSLYLNDRRSTTGTLLFGGVDTAKFIGTMAVLPIIDDVNSGNKTSFTVSMTSMSVTLTNKTTVNIPIPSTRLSNGTAPSLLDSGTTLSYLPERMADALFSAVGAVTDNSVSGLTFIACSQLTSNADMVISFTFGSATIQVPAHEVVLDVVGNAADLLPTMRGISRNDVCLFGIQSLASLGSSSSVTYLNTANFALLGDTFLRSAYVVYDLDHNQIGLAQANLNATATSVVELSATATSLPVLTGVASQVANPGGTSGGGGSGGSVAARLDGGVFAVMAVSGLFAVFGGASFIF